MKEFMVMFSYGTYVLEGEINPNFSSSDIWSNSEEYKKKVIQRRLLNYIRAIKYMQLGPDLTPEKLKCVHKMIMCEKKHPNGKDILIGEYRKTPAFADFKMFAPASEIERLINDALRKYYSANNDDPIYAATKLFVDVINLHPFEDENGRLCRVKLSHVLVQSGCSLFSVLLSSFYKRGKKHYIQTVRRYYENSSASLIHSPNMLC